MQRIDRSTDGKENDHLLTSECALGRLLSYLASFPRIYYPTYLNSS